MAHQGQLGDRLLQLRWRKSCAEAERLLSGGLGADRVSFEFLGLEDSRDRWDGYLEQLRARNDLVLEWPSHEVAGVRAWLTALRSKSGDATVLWFAYDEEEVPAVAEVPLRVMLEHAITVFVEQRRDLMLASPDLQDGVCLEVNAVGKDDELELVAWGGFAEDRKSSES